MEYGCGNNSLQFSERSKAEKGEPTDGRTGERELVDNDRDVTEVAGVFAAMQTKQPDD